MSIIPYLLTQFLLLYSGILIRHGYDIDVKLQCFPRPEVNNMTDTALHTYISHQRAQHAHEVENYNKSVFNESVIGGITGTVLGTGMVWAQMMSYGDGTLDTIVIVALLGAFIGAAVGSVDGAYRSYETSHRVILP